MSNIKKPGGQDDEKSAYVQEAEAKESSALNMHAAAKVAFRGAEWHARDAERTVEQSKRPMKDMPAGMPPTGDFRTDHAAVPTAEGDKKSDEGGDEGDGEGDSGTSGKGDGGGKALSPDLTLDSSGYTAFADAPPKSDKGDKGKKGVDTDGPDSGLDGTDSGPLPDVENKIDGPAKASGPKGPSAKSGLSSAAPASPGSGPGGKGGGPSGGAKSGPGLG